MYPPEIANRVHRTTTTWDACIVNALCVFAVPQPDVDLVRVGPDTDGGYLVYQPGKLQYDGFISAGVGNDVTFETNFLELHPTLHCDVYDHTVGGLPSSHPRLHWVPKPMSSQPLRDFLQARKDVFFKCDIEGAEWETLSGGEGGVQLEKIKQLVVEIHGLGDEHWPWGAHATLERQCRVLDALSKSHYLVHVRGNTCSPPVPFSPGCSIPEVLELTYVRKDVFPGGGQLPRNTCPFPRPQDISGATSHTLTGEPWQVSGVASTNGETTASKHVWAGHVKHILPFVNQYCIEVQTAESRKAIGTLVPVPPHAKHVRGPPLGAIDLIVSEWDFPSERFVNLLPLLRPGGYLCLVHIDGAQNVQNKEFLRLMRKLANDHVWDTHSFPAETINFIQAAVESVTIGTCNTWCVVRRRCGGVAQPPTLVAEANRFKIGQSSKPRVVAVNYAANDEYVARLPEANRRLRDWGVDAIISFGPHDFSQAFRERNAIALQERRGGGWWCWKGLIQLWAMEACADADYIVYSDIGAPPRQPLSLFLAEAQKHDADITTLQLEFPHHIERQWSKSDAFVATGTLGDPDVRDSRQVASGFALMRRNATTEMVLRLYAALLQQPHLTDNSPSRESFDVEPAFVENRHDQSVWSTMIKKMARDGPAKVRLLPFESWIHHHRNVHDPAAPKLISVISSSGNVHKTQQQKTKKTNPKQHSPSSSSSKNIPSKEVHIIVQPYDDPHPERKAEILQCLVDNALHPSVSKVHVQLECGKLDEFALDIGLKLGEAQVPLEKMQYSFEQPRMTFGSAIRCANESGTIAKGSAVCILNADIYLGASPHWPKLCADGTPQFLTRWEHHPCGNISMNEEFFTHGHSCDAWCFQTPVPDIPGIADIRVGNQLGCDGFVAGQAIDAGVVPRNDAIKFPVVHIDKCAHRNRVDTSIFSAVDQNVSAEKTLTCGATSRYAQLRVGCATDEERKVLRLCNFSRQPVDVSERHFATQRQTFGDAMWKWA